jgi:hypothetical protein
MAQLPDPKHPIVGPVRLMEQAIVQIRGHKVMQPPEPRKKPIDFRPD